MGLRHFIGCCVALLLLCSFTTAQTPVTKYSPPQVDKALQAKYRQVANKHSCPNGIPWLQGKWAFVGQSRVPGFKDIITFSGSKYVEELSGGRPGREEKGVLHGDIACVDRNRVLFRVHKVLPEGLFGNRSGDDFPCDILTPVDRNNRDRFLMVCFVDWDLRTAKGLDFEYHRVKPPVKESTKKEPGTTAAPSSSDRKNVSDDKK